MNVQTKKRKQVPTNMAIVVILSFTIGCLYWYFWQNVTTDVEWYSQEISGRIVKINKNSNNAKKDLIALISLMEKNGKYGEWPIGRVSLSESRGNPFVKKN